MSSFEDELLHEVNWRNDEISTLKIIPHRYDFSGHEKKLLEKYSIPSIYSLWEGFVSEGFSIYINHINQLAHKHDWTVKQISKSIIVNHLDTENNLSDGRKNFDKKIALVCKLYNYFQLPLNISTKIPTKSNVNFNVITDILSRFNLQPLPEKPFQRDLDKLVKIRNNIAHGEVITAISESLIDDISISTSNLIYEVFNRIVEGYQKRTFLENAF